MRKGKWKLKCRKGGAIIMMTALLLGSVDGQMANVFASDTESTEMMQEKESQTEAESSQSEISGTETQISQETKTSETKTSENTDFSENAEKWSTLLQKFAENKMMLSQNADTRNVDAWKVENGVLIVTGAIKLEEVTEEFTSVEVKEGGSITAGTINCPIKNEGIINGCTFGKSASVSSNTGTIKVSAVVDNETMWFDYGVKVKDALAALEDHPLFSAHQVWAYWNKYGSKYAEVNYWDTFKLINETYLRAWRYRVSYSSQVGFSDALTGEKEYITPNESYKMNVMSFGAKEERENYTFLGWSEDRNATTAAYSTDGRNNTQTKITLTKDQPVMKLWAIWQGDYHIVLNIEDETITYGDSINVKAVVTDSDGSHVTDGTMVFKWGDKASEPITVTDGGVFSLDINTIDADGNNAKMLQKGLNYIWGIYTPADNGKTVDSRGGYIRLNPLKVKPVLLTEETVWSPEGFNQSIIDVGFVAADSDGTGKIYRLTHRKTIEDSSGTALSLSAKITNAGDYKVNVTALSNVGGGLYGDSEIAELAESEPLIFSVKKLDLSDPSVSIIAKKQTKTYDGNPVSTSQLDYRVSVSVGTSSYQIVLADWEVSTVPGKNSTEAGTAYVRVSAAPDSQKITGSRELAITIEKAPQTLVGTTSYKRTFGDEDFSIFMEKTGKEGTLTYQVVSGDDVVSVTDKGVVSIKKAGTAVVRVSVAETGNYVAAKDVDVTITVAKAPGKGSVTIENWTYSPDGSNAAKPVAQSDTNGTDHVVYLYKVQGADDSTYSEECPVKAGNYTVKAIFEATENYLESSATADFIIEKAEKPDNMPQGEDLYIEVPNDADSLKDITLPEGWTWKDDSVKLIPGGVITAIAVYKDVENYENCEVEIQIAKPAEIISETDCTYTNGKDKQVVIHSTGAVSELTGVYVDGTKVDMSGYTVAEGDDGSTIITFNQTYLDALSIGEHKITLSYTAGDADVTLTVKKENSQSGKTEKPVKTDNDSNKGKKVSPKTGDQSPIDMYILLMVIAAGVMGTVCVKRKESKR